jgi:hypothetical protein
VTSGEGNMPLRGALVTATVPGQPLPITALTDETGRYELTGLPAGRYPITASQPGYIRLAYGQTRPAQGGKPIVVAERQTLENVNFALPRGGVIAGSVIDETGQPVIGAIVGALQRVYKNGKASAIPVSLGNNISSLMMTNDLGEFRVYGLEPGIFYVGATRVSATDGRPSAMIYAPGSASLSDAQQVRVGLAQTVAGISIVMRSMKAAMIAGIALDANQQPIAGRLELRQRDVDLDSGGILRSARPDPDGAFIFTDVPPGDYTIGAIQRSPGVLRGAFAQVRPDGTNLSDVRLTPIGIATASGHVISSPSNPRPPSGSRVRFEPVDANLSSFGFFTTVGTSISDDLTFSIQAFAVRMKVDMPQLPAGWTLKAVRYRGTDVTDSGVELVPGDEVRDIEVEITNRLTEITGTVRTANGELADDYTVIIFAKDPTRRTGNPRYFASARPDQNRSFWIRGLAAGEYLVVALEYADLNIVEDPVFIESVAKGAASLTLRDAETRTLQLVLSP